MHRLTLIFLAYLNISATQIDKNILFSVNDSVVTVEEFNKVYNKNIDLIDENNQKDFESYLDLFINYKLKLAEAYTTGLHKDPKYISELNKYTRQLQKSYLTDKKTEDKFLKEAYERIKYEVNVSHVLIRVNEDNNDTIDIYNKLSSLREPFIKNSIEDFNTNFNTNDEMIVENLGYFSAFKMIYRFENMAYNTAVGKVSLPFRSKFGFHILKVNDKRVSLGEVSVGHIMMYKNKNGAFERINNILDSINSGLSFEYLAKKYSEDKNSSFKGGRLNPFYSGQINSIPFEKAAYRLDKKNDISNVVETKYGWHIIKFYSKKNVKKFNEVKYELLNKLKRSSRYSIISDSFYSSLLKRYGLNYQNSNLDYFSTILDSTYFYGKWTIPKGFLKEKNLLRINETNLTYADFAVFLENNQKKIEKISYEKVISNEYRRFVNFHVMEYYKSNLENEDDDYNFVYREYKEGLLLFNLMQDKIWNVSESDTINLRNFYNENKEKYSSFEQDRGKIIGDFQDFQERLWLEELRVKHKVILNNKVIKKLKRQYK